jgi:CPA2 family monovalent cation:H+ antiporter-2
LPLLVIDEQKSELADIQAKGIETLTGPAGEQALLDRVNLARARWLILAIPNAFEAGHLILQARAANPNIRILARAHHNDEVDHLRSLGADVIVMGEEEIARTIISDILRSNAPKSGSFENRNETPPSSKTGSREQADGTEQ